MSKRRKSPPKDPVVTAVEKLSHDGRGLAYIGGKITFIQGALSNEKVSFQYLRQKKDYDEGVALSIIEPSPERVNPKCPHYEMCGGCSLQHLDEQVQIQEKEAILLELLARHAHIEPKVVLPPLTGYPWNYRNKARLSVRYVEKKGAVLVGFREKNNGRFIADITQCPILHKKIDRGLLELRALIGSFSDPKSIAQIEVAAGDTEVALIFRNLSALNASDEQKLKAFGEKSGFKLYLQPGGMDTVSIVYPESASPMLQYDLPDEQIRFEFHPTDFTQVNTEINRKMVKKALELLELNQNDKVLDLFCGLGNFSLPIARHCSSLTGVEGSDAMVKRAESNAIMNQLANTEFFAANLDEEDSLARWGKNAFDKVLIDPPRTGALAVVKQINKLNPSRLVYVSCNPVTLARDAEVLVNTQGYTLKAAGVMDMFPHTAHVESIALFIKE